MRTILVSEADAGKRADRALRQALPALSQGALQKFLREKRVKLDGRAVQPSDRLNAGDCLTLYLPDECFRTPAKVDTFLQHFRPHLQILFENDQLLVLDKRPGLLVHPDETEKVDTLLTHVRAYLSPRGVYDSTDPASFDPVLVNRIDRFTGGIVMAAKTEEAKRVLLQKIRDRELEKDYLAILLRPMRRDHGVLDQFLRMEGKRVRVYNQPVPEAKRAVTRYETLAVRPDGLTLLRVQIETGRTHQIRAQLAAAGSPILGDAQYGDARFNRAYEMSFQALYANRLVFAFTTDAGSLNALNGRAFTAPEVPFVRRYFPDQAPV